MRHLALLALSLVTACATATTAAPSAAAAAGEKAATSSTPAARPMMVEFASAEATKTGGAVADTSYSEKPGDAAITGKTFAGGVVTYAGQVGFHKGSTWAGIGLGWDIAPDQKPVDATAYKSITFRLASTAGMLRVRLVGADKETRSNGCYPIVMQQVSPELKEYTIPVSRFAAESWCGDKARGPKDVLPALAGFEVASPDMTAKPITISAGSVTLNP